MSIVIKLFKRKKSPKVVVPDIVREIKSSDFDPAMIQESNMNMKTSTGMTLVHIAAREGNLPALERLHNLGADLHAKDNFGDTPLVIAEIRQHQVVVEYLQKN